MISLPRVNLGAGAVIKSHYASATNRNRLKVMLIDQGRPYAATNFAQAVYPHQNHITNQTPTSNLTQETRDCM